MTDSLASTDAHNAIARLINGASCPAEKRAIAAAVVEKAFEFFGEVFGHEAAAARAAEMVRRCEERRVRVPPGRKRS